MQKPVERDRLSAREQEILGYVCEGYTNEQIAGALCISPNTVHAHIGRIREKMGVHSKTHAAAIWVREYVNGTKS